MNSQDHDPCDYSTLLPGDLFEFIDDGFRWKRNKQKLPIKDNLVLCGDYPDTEVYLDVGFLLVVSVYHDVYVWLSKNSLHTVSISRLKQHMIGVNVVK